MKFSIIEIKDQLAQSLSAGRFKHTLGVTETAQKLALQYNADIYKAELAGLLHDCAKELKQKKLLQEALRFDIELNDIDRAAPHLLHARVGAHYAKELYGVNDPEVLGAIAQHTLGKPEMSLLEEILFLSDAIEPNRPSEWANSIRQTLKDKGLEAAIVKTCENTIHEVVEKKRLLHPLTVETYNFYLQKLTVSKDKEEIK